MKVRTALVGAAVAAALVVAAASAHATIVERVVAVVGEKAILLSDLKARARPFLLRMQDQAPDQARQAAATSQVYTQMLDRMIDEELEERAASKANIAITAREVDDALARIASQNNVTVQAVVDEAVRSGLTERQYRREIRRQLLEAKLLNLRVQGRLRVTEDDLQTTYRELVKEERSILRFRAAWIRISAPRGSPAAVLKARRQIAERVVQQARGGASFAQLSNRHSTDVRARNTGGLLGELRPGQLPPAVDKIAQALEVGEVSEPIRDGNDFVILKMIQRESSRLPPYSAARAELGQRVYMEKMEKARRHWLNGLRRRTHVDVRL